MAKKEQPKIYRKNVSALLRLGEKPKDIYKGLRSAYSQIRKSINLEKKTYSKEIYQNRITSLKKDMKDDFRLLNPAREQIKEIKKLKAKQTFKKIEHIKVGVFADIKETKFQLSKNQTKTLTKFRENYFNEVRKSINRFNRYGKAINLSRLTVNVAGKDTSLTQLHKDYLNTSDTKLKREISKKLNFGFKQLKKIEVSKHGENTTRIYSGKLENVKEGMLIESVTRGIHFFETIDTNGNVIG